jgi:hypothetical protein
MIKSLSLLPLLLVAAPLLANGNADAVNERIPVRHDEMELHWNINCADSWTNLAQSPENVTAQLQQQLLLCGMIYQPPGEPAVHRCPDYGSAAEAVRVKDQPTLAALLGAATTCAPSTPP